MDRRGFLKRVGLLTLAISPITSGFADTPETKEKKPKKIILTIDDGPRKTMEQLLTQLGIEEKPVIFYCIGKNLETNIGQYYARLAIMLGHVIGNHSYNHPIFTKVNLTKAKFEIQKTEDLINKLYDNLGILRQRKFFRFPYGAVSQQVKEYLQENNFTIQGWDVDSNDWRYYSKNKQLRLDRIISNCKQAKDNNIVLVHDKPITAEYLIPIFTNSQEYKLVLPT